ETFSGVKRRMDHRAVRHNRDLTTVAQYFTFADFKQLRFAIDGNTHAVAARISHRRRSRVLQHRKQHVAHLALVLRGHHDDVWNGAKISDVDQTVVSLSVTTGDTAAVQTKLHVEILYADVVDQLIVTALKKRGVDRADRLQTFTRHTGGERDAVLFGNTDVESPVGKLLERSADTCAVGHRGSQSDDLWILLHELRERICEYLGVCRRL